MKDENIRDSIMIVTLARMLKIKPKDFIKEMANMKENAIYLLDITRGLINEQ